MNFIVPLAALLGIEIESLTDQVKRSIIGNALIGMFALIGLVFLLIAGFLALADSVGPVYAGLIFAAVSLALALITYLVLQMQEGNRRRLALEKRRSTESSAFVTSAALTALPVILRSPLFRTVGVPIAAVAAFFFLKGKDD
jgi:cobalamin synthase